MISEENFGTARSVDRTNKALSTYKWNNVGGDGLTQYVVVQTGPTLNFYSVTAATVSSPLSQQLLSASIDVSTFVASGNTFDTTLECQFTDGNGYLFVFHPSCDPFYITSNAGVLTGNKITVKIRDFLGLPDNLATTVRPASLSAEHNYNLNNQGWTSGGAWIATDTGVHTGNLVGSQVFTVASGLSITGGDTVSIYCTMIRLLLTSE